MLWLVRRSPVLAGAPTGPPTATIAARLRSISVDFGGERQTLANSVIDVHAFVSGRLFVEVVIENGRGNASAATVTAPATTSYLSGTVEVNKTTIATVSNPTSGDPFPNARKKGNFAGGHEPLRAWYCSTRVGGDPGIEVTHDAGPLQAHPWFFKPAESSGQIMQSKYAQSYDTYVPWATCRLRMPGMSVGGDDEQIAMLTRRKGRTIPKSDLPFCRFTHGAYPLDFIAGLAIAGISDGPSGHRSAGPGRFAVAMAPDHGRGAQVQISRESYIALGGPVVF